MTLTTIHTKMGVVTLDNVSDFEIVQGCLILELNNGQNFKVYQRDRWYEANINKVKGELTDGA